MELTRVAIIVSHPIQHFCPQYSSWAALEGVELQVFFASRQGLEPYADKNFGIDIQWQGLKLDFPHEFLPGAEGRKVGVRIDCPELERRLAAFRPDVLVSYGYSQKLQRRGLHWAEANGIPALFISDSELHSRRGLLKSAMKKLLIPGRYRPAKLFLSVGDSNEAYYRNYGVRDDQMVRCFFPIDRKHYDAVLKDRAAAARRVRTEHAIQEHHKVVLNVGKFVPWKRQRDLVLMSNGLQGQRDDITVILAGTGKDEPELRKLCRKEGPGGVVFAGFIVPEKLAEYYCATDVYMHCSSLEPHSLAISEAIYCGLPVVLSDRCGSYGPTDDVRPGLNGFVYRCGDTAKMSSVLQYVVDDPGLYGNMSEVSTRISRQHQALAHGGALLQALAIVHSAPGRPAGSS